ncbi:hypothetical protein [Paludibacterium paludis]|uniref:hypothetical protein n=1 Tax=Paludibacterium paludis TaxID=1225769 RepID=UPI001C05235E|nr:hypothetical protein [Paludibacterium paludis]
MAPAEANQNELPPIKVKRAFSWHGLLETFENLILMRPSDHSGPGIYTYRFEPVNGRIANGKEDPNATQWNSLLKQAGNCIRGESRGGTPGQTDNGNRGTGGAGGSPPAGNSGKGDGAAAGGDGQEPFRYVCPRRLAQDAADSPALVAFRMALQQSYLIAMMLTPYDGNASLPVRMALRQWAERLEILRTRASSTLEFDELLRAQGPVLVEINTLLERILQFHRQQLAPRYLVDTQAGSEAYLELLHIMRRGFAPDSLQQVRTQLQKLVAAQDSGGRPASANARAYRNLSGMLTLGSDYANQFPEQTTYMRQVFSRLTGNVSRISERDAGTLARVVGYLMLRGSEIYTLRNIFHTGPEAIPEVPRFNFAMQSLAGGPASLDAAEVSRMIGRLEQTLEGLVQSNPRTENETVARFLTDALAAMNLDQIPWMQAPNLARLKRNENVRGLVRRLGPDGAVELIRSIHALRRQLQMGLLRAEQSHMPPIRTVSAAAEQLRARLATLSVSDSDPAEAYIAVRDHLQTTVLEVEQIMMPRVYDDLDWLERYFREHAGTSRSQLAVLDPGVFPALRMLRSNVTLDDIGAVRSLRNQIESMVPPGYNLPSFAALFGTFVSRADFSAPPVETSGFLHNSHVWPLYRQVVEWDEARRRRWREQDRRDQTGTPSPNRPPVHDEHRK